MSPATIPEPASDGPLPVPGRPARTFAASTATRYVVRVLALLALLVFVCAGCASRPAVPDFKGGGGKLGAPPLVIEVVNDNYHDVVVYLDPGSGWQRIGTVTGLCTQDLEVPGPLHAPASDYRIRVHAIGTSEREDWVDETVFADRGDLIELHVAGELSLSHWIVRRGT